MSKQNNDEDYEYEEVEVLVDEEGKVIEEVKKKKSNGNIGYFCKKCLCIFEKKSDSRIHECNKSLTFEKNLLSDFYFANLVKDSKNYEKNVSKLQNKIYELESVISGLKFKSELVYKIQNEIMKTCFDNLENVNLNVDINIGQKKKEYYRSINKNEDKSEEEKRELIDSIEKDLDERGKKYFNESKEDILKDIENEFKLYETSKDDNHLIVIKNKRNKLYKYLDVDKYQKIIEDHLSRYNKFFSNIKSKPRLNTKLEQFFSVLETRLLSLHCNINKEVDPDEIGRYEIGLEFFNVRDNFKLLDKNELVKKIMTPVLAYNSIQKVLKRELIDKAGFHNLVFIPLNPKQNLKDPFTYYHLEKIERGVRYWKMDYRLLEITDFLRNNIINYLIEQYRKFCFIIYADNNIRKNVSSVILEQECQQVLENLILVSNHYKFSLMIQNIIKENNKFELTKNDKYDFFSDDKELAKLYDGIKTEDYEDYTLSNIEALYDNIDQKDVEEIYNNNVKKD